MSRDGDRRGGERLRVTQCAADIKTDSSTACPSAESVWTGGVPTEDPARRLLLAHMHRLRRLTAMGGLSCFAIVPGSKCGSGRVRAVSGSPRNRDRRADCQGNPPFKDRKSTDWPAPWTPCRSIRTALGLPIPCGRRSTRTTSAAVHLG